MIKSWARVVYELIANEAKLRYLPAIYDETEWYNCFIIQPKLYDNEKVQTFIKSSSQILAILLSVFTTHRIY